MKKVKYITIAFMFSLSAWNVSAQESYYYHVGDTITGRSPIYYYQWWSEAWLADTSHRLTVLCDPIEIYGGGPGIPPIALGFHGEILQFFHTDIPIQIIGIATTCITTQISSYWIDFHSDPLYPEYLRLYDATEEDFYLLKEVQYDRRAPKRYLDLDLRNHSEWDVTSRCCYWETPDRIRTVDIREYYFDKPVTVSDSFYLGHTIENAYGWTADIHRDTIDSHQITIQPGCLVWDEYIWQYPNYCNHSCGSTPNHLKKYRNIIWDIDYASPTFGDTIDSLSAWRWTETPYYMLEFPIVVIDSSYIIPPYECPPVTNLRIAHMDEGRAILYWDSHADHVSFQTCFGLQGTPPDSCTRFNCPIQVGDIRGLDSCTHYDAYVRAVCYHDSTCYSNWVGPLDIFICDTTSGGEDPNGIASTANMMTHIVPNPATTQVNVYSSFLINRVEVFSLQGKKMADMTADGHSASFSVSDWPSGLYIVTVHTQAGNVAKKLIVK